jgi:hypothetical protein
MRGAAIAWVFVAACSTPTTTPAYDNSVLAPLNLTFSTEPPAGADGVALDATAVVTFDDYPDPDTVGFGPVLLRSGKANFDSDIRVDLVHQSVRIRGRAPLQPGTTYEVLIDPTVTGFDGRASLDTVAFTFTTGAQPITPPPTPLPPVTWSDIQYALASQPVPADGCPPPPQSSDMAPVLGGCAPYCHTPCGGSGLLRAPTRRLDLSADPNDPVYGLIHVPSAGLQGTRAQIPRVLPGDSSHSLLLRKLLGGGQLPDPGDQPYPFVRADGKRMPIGECSAVDADGGCLVPGDPTDYFVHPLPFALLEQIQRWIDDGAIVP